MFGTISKLFFFLILGYKIKCLFQYIFEIGALCLPLILISENFEQKVWPLKLKINYDIKQFYVIFLSSQ